jgi:hypothetical protein
MSASTIPKSEVPRSQPSKKLTKGWRFAILAHIGAASTVLILNLIFVIVGESRNGFPRIETNGGRRAIYRGSCETTKKLSIAVHLVINIFSTILLGASNYCMQCMSAPSRNEVDEAHASASWLHIGSPSIRNLFKISRQRVIIWLLLGLSSIPLHLL